jgi:hypothetical protein
MVLIKARLYGGPWDGRTVSINVDDVQNPPALRKVGYSRRGPKGRAQLHTYRRAARDPWNSRVWDYVSDTPEGLLNGHQQSSRDLFKTRRR